MNLDENDSAYRSFMGAFCTIIIFLFLLSFSYTKLITLIEKSDVDIMQAAEDSAIMPDEVFGSGDGLFLAAALTEYNSDPSRIEKPEYGELRIEQYGWGNEDIGMPYGSTPIPNHFCSDEEIGLSKAKDGDSIIYPIDEGLIK